MSQPKSAIVLLLVALAGAIAAPTQVDAASTGPWSALAAGLNANAVTAIAVSGSDIYVGGQFTDAGGVTDADYVARWSSGAWHALPHNNDLGGPAIDNYVYALAVASNGDLYVGGQFSNASGLATANGLARWNGSDWSEVGSYGSGGGGKVNALAISGNDMWVGGTFSNAAGLAAADAVARYDIGGNSWSSPLPFTAPTWSSAASS